MATLLRLTAISIFISRFRRPQPPFEHPTEPVDVKDYLISGDDLIERQNNWGFTPEGLAQMKAAINHPAEPVDADA